MQLSTVSELYVPSRTSRLKSYLQIETTSFIKPTCQHLNCNSKRRHDLCYKGDIPCGFSSKPSGNILAKILHRNLGILGQQSWPRGSKILGSLGHSLGQDPGVLGGLTLAKRPKILPRSLPENPCLLAKILGFNPDFILQCILPFMYMHVTLTM